MTKERLRAYGAIKRESEQLRQKIEAVEAALYGPKIQKLTGMPSNPSPGNAMEDLAAKHLELLELYGGKMMELAAEQLAIEEAINALDSTSRMLLRYRYIDGLKWEEVCVKMGYSWTQTHYIHGEALKKLREKETEP